MRVAVAQIRELDPFEALAGRSPCVCDTGQQQWKLHIFENGKGMQQLEGLEDEAYF